MKIFNTTSRSIELFSPVNHGKINFYACGFTVYDYAHLGHLRRYAMDDVLIRVLRHEGYLVKFVQNITDVGHLSSDADSGEDKLEKGAKKYGQTVWEVAHNFEEHFFYSMDKMGNLRPDISCRATEHIDQQIKMVQQLEQKGYTYIIDGDGVYFDTSKLDDYGKLARLNIAKIAELKAGARVEMIEGKRNPTDFALWKFERSGENRAMVWESPWAKRGFPGWHIECSAMAIHYLGSQLDIHTGGIDHIEIHHSNEIAQAETATGKKPFVKYWVHHNFVKVAGEKMSKSLGNFFTIDDVIEHGYDPMALRLLYLGAHYRSELNFTWENLAGSQKAWEKLCKLVSLWERQVGGNQSSQQNIGNKNRSLDRSISHSVTSLTSNEYDQKFWSALQSDLDTPQALSALWEMAKSDLPATDKLTLWHDWSEVLGLVASNFNSSKADLDQPDQILDTASLPQNIQILLEKRRLLRQQKNWSQADNLRAEIMNLGYRVVDQNELQLVSKVE